MGNCLGFGPEGVRKGACAARIQACCYGGEIPAGGWFACCQRRGAKGDGKGSTVTVCFGLFLGILGILFIAGGVMVGYYPKKLEEPILFYVEDATQHEFLPTYQLMIAIGVFLFLSAVCACCFGVGDGDKVGGCCLLLAFIMVIVVVGRLSYSVSKFDSERVESDIRKNMMAKINTGSTDPILDYIQQNLECCGVEGPSDWQHNIKFNNETVPDSCCKVETPDCGQNYRPDNIFLGGCLTNMMHKITTYFYWQISFLAFFCLTAIFVISSCCCIIFANCSSSGPYTLLK